MGWGRLVHFWVLYKLIKGKGEGGWTNFVLFRPVAAACLEKHTKRKEQIGKCNMQFQEKKNTFSYSICFHTGAQSARTLPEKKVGSIVYVLSHAVSNDQTLLHVGFVVFFPSSSPLSLLSTLYQSAYKTRDFELSYCVCKAKKKVEGSPGGWYESLFEGKSIFLLLFILALLPPFSNKQYCCLCCWL